MILRLLTLSFTLISVSTFSQVTNQRLFDTIPFMPEHYARRVSTFEKEKIASGATVFLGNSITEGGQWKKLTGDTTVVNRGIGGDITFGVLKRLKEIVDAKPSRVFLLIGINDIGKDIPDAVIADNIRKIIEHFARNSPKTKIYVQSILPVNPGVNNFPQHYAKNDHVKSTNKLIKKICKNTRVDFIDLYKIFSKRGVMDPKYSPDGLHLNAEGYARWAAYLKRQKISPF